MHISSVTKECCHSLLKDWYNLNGKGWNRFTASNFFIFPLSLLMFLLLGLNLLGLSVFLNFGLFVFLFFWRFLLFIFGRYFFGRFLVSFIMHRNSLDEVFPADSIVLHVVEAELQSRQVFVGDMEAAVFADPVRESVDCDVAQIVFIHVGE